MNPQHYHTLTRDELVNEGYLSDDPLTRELASELAEAPFPEDLDELTAIIEELRGELEGLKDELHRIQEESTDDCR